MSHDDVAQNSRRSAGANRRTFLKTAGTLASTAALGLSGCIGGGSGGGGSGPVKIGHLAPVQLDMGKGSMNSANMLVDHLNEDGGILDRDVELVEGDTQLSPSQANQRVQEMVNQENVAMISGTFASETMLGIEDRVADLNVPFLDTGSASPQITEGHVGQNYEKYKNVFRNNPVNADFQADLLGEYAKFLSDQHGWNSFAVVVEDAEWTNPVTNRTPGVIEDAGLEVAMTRRISPDTTDFTPILDSVEESGASCMLKAISHITGTAMLSTWGAGEYPFAQEGINVASMSPQYWSDTNGGCLYETTAESGGGGTAEITDKTVPFTEDYAGRFTERPTLPMYMGYGTYDAGYVFKEAAEAAGTVDFENNLDDIVAELENTDYTGTAGQIQFYGQDHQYPHDVKYGNDFAPFPIVQWQGDAENDMIEGEGAKVCVWPEEFAAGDHQIPQWMA
ncbi:ABC transporter substrate-binding protein [Halorientalis sp.]|uniref:ABC transporter substrate-binding protein n=1 Tax=Halorientalis sp. TaxID=1931229 RepID=UPI002621374E|nr:ABC transporter substrate-binding protein [Halorientalis sp.]